MILKGSGSDNCSFFKMCIPADGIGDGAGAQPVGLRARDEDAEFGGSAEEGQGGGRENERSPGEDHRVSVACGCALTSAPTAEPSRSGDIEDSKPVL